MPVSSALMTALEVLLLLLLGRLLPATETAGFRPLLLATCATVDGAAGGSFSMLSSSSPPVWSPSSSSTSSSWSDKVVILPPSPRFARSGMSFVA